MVTVEFLQKMISGDKGDVSVSREEIGAMAVIINDYGSFQGLLTMEDIIETVLGNEIVDERDIVVDMQQLARDRWNKRFKKKQKA